MIALDPRMMIAGVLFLFFAVHLLLSFFWLNANLWLMRRSLRDSKSIPLWTAQIAKLAVWHLLTSKGVALMIRRAFSEENARFEVLVLLMMAQCLVTALCVAIQFKETLVLSYSRCVVISVVTSVTTGLSMSVIHFAFLHFVAPNIQFTPRDN